MSLPLLHLVDSSADVARSLVEAFRGFAEVEVVHGDLLDVAHTAAVAPCNSYGFMDGGIDHSFFRYFGAEVERVVRDRIS